MPSGVNSASRRVAISRSRSRVRRPAASSLATRRMWTMPCTRSRSPSKSGMRVCGVSRSRSADLVPVGGDVDAVDVAARHHDVLDRAALEVEQRLDHALALGGLGDERIRDVGDASPPDRAAPAASSRRGSSRKNGATSQTTRRAAALAERRRRGAASRAGEQRPAARARAATATRESRRAARGAARCRRRAAASTSARSARVAWRVRRGSSPIRRRSPAIQGSASVAGAARRVRKAGIAASMQRRRAASSASAGDRGSRHQPQCRPSTISSTNLLPK